LATQQQLRVDEHAAGWRSSFGGSLQAELDLKVI